MFERASRGRFAHIVVVAVVVIYGVMAVSASAAMLPVTKSGDSLDGACDADCSLREAVARANLDGTEDTIVLPAGSFSLTLAAASEDANASGDIDVTQDLVIRGAGAALTTIQVTLPDSTPDRAIDLIGTADLTVIGTAVAGGRGELYGGGIRSNGVGRLTLQQVVVRDNTVTGQAALGYGGGVYKAQGSLVMRDAAVHGNRAVGPGYGGGVFLNNLGTTASLTNVTISGNTAGSSGGGVFSNNEIEADLAHVTVTRNEAGSSGGFGGDVSAVRLRSSIVAGNSAPGHANCSSAGYAPASVGGNVGDPICGLTLASDRPTLDARLGPLGGAPIPVAQPEADSPAVNHSAGECPSADARGVARPQGPACDAGAAERPAPPVTPPPAADTTRPVLSAVSLNRSRFRVARGPTPVGARRAPAGTTVRYSLSEAATVRLRFQRARPGRRVRGRCRKPTVRNRSRRPCLRYVAVGRALERSGVAGANSIRFTGRIGRRALRPGRYRGILVATDAAGNRSSQRPFRFRIVLR
jgi:CSLREA domain-containing protein